MREHHPELEQRTTATETQDKASKTRKYRVKLGNRRGEGQTRDQLARGVRDEGEMINLEIGLDEQTQWMYHKMGEMMGCSEKSVDKGCTAWRREDAGDEWQRWNGNCSNKQDLNSRQRRKISRDVRRMIIR